MTQGVSIKGETPAVAMTSTAHLLGRLRVVEARVRGAVAVRRDSDPDPDDRFRGLHVSPAQAERLLRAGAALFAPDPEAGARLAELEAAADAAEAAGDDLRLRRLARGFGLDALDLELILIALAPDLERRFEPLYGYLHDDISRRRASVGLWLELCEQTVASGAGHARLAAVGSLARGQLIVIEDAERPFLTRSVRVPDRVTAFLLGQDNPDPAIAPLLRECEPLASEVSTRLERWRRGGGSLAYVRERPGTAGWSTAAAALEACGEAGLAVDLARLPPDAELVSLAPILSREAILLEAAVLAGPVEALVARGPAAVRAFTELPVPVVLVGGGHWDPAWSRQVPFVCEALAAPGDNVEAWRASLNCGAGDLDPAEATRQFRLTPEQVRRAGAFARLQAQAADRPLEGADLSAGARAQNAAGLERLATRIEPAVGFEDLVLAGEVMGQLRELTVRARYRRLVLDQWRMGGSASRRRGLTALFAGASGTGKTMAAEVVAGEMGLDLYVVDISSVVDKYIGETEKNLDRIFSEAERCNAVLLFDEADALFGKRSDVGDAHDRYANVEVAYLLQRMELFEGTAILATNLRSNLDEAFARRLDALIDFPEPEEQDRLRLWDRCLGPLAPRAPDLDLAFLARAFKLSGGNIRNIVTSAAYSAAEAERAIGMVDLVRATQREYRKLGRMVVESEFGAYYDLARG